MTELERGSRAERFPISPERLLAIGARFCVWVALFSALYVLRAFFLLLFLTFVFTYIQAHGAEKLAPYLPRRPFRVSLISGAFLLVLVLVGVVIIPQVVSQARIVADAYPTYLEAADSKVIALAEEYPVLGDIMGVSSENSKEGISPSSIFFQQLLSLDDHGAGSQSIARGVQVLRELGGTVMGVVSAFFLALLFSFLIVLDLPRLSESVQSLQLTKIRFIYDEVVPSLRDFGEVLGRALEAQLMIAIINTILTGVVIYFLGLGDNLTFLSMIVFLSSFIPVAGVFISSVPICLMVIPKSGFTGVAITVTAIWIVHMVEAYVLNPKIFGHHLRINPVLVLIILTIAGKLFHVWGLILGLPVCTYIFGHAIRYRE